MSKLQSPPLRALRGGEYFSEILHVVLQDTAVHHHLQTRGSAQSGSRFILGTELHPNNAGTAADGGLYNVRNVFGPAEDVDDVKGFGNVVQSRIGHLTKDFGLEGIHRDNPISGTLHVSGNRKARAPRMRGQSDNCNRFVFLKDLLDAHSALSRAARNA